MRQMHTPEMFPMTALMGMGDGIWAEGKGSNGNPFLGCRQPSSSIHTSAVFPFAAHASVMAYDGAGMTDLLFTLTALRKGLRLGESRSAWLHCIN